MEEEEMEEDEEGRPDSIEEGELPAVHLSIAFQVVTERMIDDCYMY